VLITRPGESYRLWRVRVWSWSLDNEEFLALEGLKWSRWSWVLFLSGARYMYLLQNLETGSGTDPVIYWVGTGCSILVGTTTVAWS